MLCPRCGEGRRGAHPIPLGALKVLRYMQTHENADCAALRPQGSTCDEVEEVLQRYLVYVLERKLKSVEFVNMLRSSDAAHGTRGMIPGG